MTEQNNPVDLDHAQIARYKAPVEQLFTNYRYRGQSRSLPELLLQLDPDEKYVMSNVERDAYLTIREGMQIFEAIADLLSDKVGLKQKLIATPNSDLSGNAELNRLRSFCHDFATFAAATYIVKKLHGLIRAEGVAASEAQPDLSDLGLSLDSAQPMSAVVRRLLAPIYAYLVEQAESGDAFSSPLVFVVFVRDVFEQYRALIRENIDAYPEFEQHLRGYRFRILDDFVVLEGYADISVNAAPAAAQPLTFQPIRAEEIVGNHHAKQKIRRYVERLCLYDPAQQMNPMLELGGLAWTSLYDGLPGTGKSSLFRLAMTLLSERSAQAGLPYTIFTVDQSIKDEYYGKTGKILLQRLAVTHDPQTVSLGILDDIDLLTSARDDAQGADNDINNILMQYLDGVFTVRRGNVINFAASNKPTGLDDALRNRFNDRLMIDGPVSAEDFADMVHILGGKLLDKGLIAIEQGYAPFAAQSSGGARPHPTDAADSSENVAAYMAEAFQAQKHATLKDFGQFMADLKGKNPKITGRSTRAIIEAIKERSADFDLPPEWFEQRAIFLDQPYAAKIRLLTELYRPITPDVLFQEAQRYFDSEERFAQAEADAQITRGYHALMWDAQAQITYYAEQAAQGNTSAVARLHTLKRRLTEHLR